MAPVPNPTENTSPWWLGSAWNEDSLDWFLQLEEIEAGASLAALGVIFDEYQPAFPAVAPPAEWLAKLYSAIGDPPREEEDSQYGHLPNVASNFRYDPADPTLGLPMQLLRYYLDYNGNQGGFEMLTPDRIPIRLQQLLTVIEFTPTEWEWLLEKLEPESFNLFGGLFKLVVNNPFLPALPSSEKLNGYRPIEFIDIQVRNGLQFLLRETLKLQTGQEPAPSRTAVFNELSIWAKGVNASAGTLTEAVAILDKATAVSAETHHKITSQEVGPIHSRTPEYVFCLNAVALLETIASHPNYGNPRALELSLHLRESLDLDTYRFAIEFQALEAATQDITDPGHRNWTEWAEIQHSAGLVPYTADEGFFSATESLHLLYALANFSEQEARTVFQNTILTPYLNDRQFFAGAYMMPMLSGFLKELREDFDDKGRNIPLTWIIDASSSVKEVSQ